MNNCCICWFSCIPLNAELNPTCHLLALLGGATIVVVSRLRVNEYSTIAYNTLEYIWVIFHRIMKNSQYMCQDNVSTFVIYHGYGSLPRLPMFLCLEWLHRFSRNG